MSISGFPLLQPSDKHSKIIGDYANCRFYFIVLSFVFTCQRIRIDYHMFDTKTSFSSFVFVLLLSLMAYQPLWVI